MLIDRIQLIKKFVQTDNVKKKIKESSNAYKIRTIYSGGEWVENYKTTAEYFMLWVLQF